LSKIYGEGEEEGWFQATLQWKIGSGDKVTFWEDAWLGRYNLITLYSRLFSLSLDQGMIVGEVKVWESSEWHWRDMLRYISTGTIKREAKDMHIWREDSTCDFLVRSAYECLVNHGFGHSYCIFN